MFGYACSDTPELMPLPIALAHRILNRLTVAAEAETCRLAAARQQEPGDDRVRRQSALRVDTVVVSTQHSPDAANGEIRNFVINEIIAPSIPEELMTSEVKYHINPTGRFVVGGPHGDCGLTGRKIIVDTYGGWGRHGGGAFSGKDPTKVDRSAAYMARHVAKNIVAAGLAERCEVQLAYAIGVTEPVSVYVNTEGTGRIDDAGICQLVRRCSRSRPAGSSSIWICAGRSIVRQRPVGTLAAASPGSLGKTPIARPNWPKRPASPPRPAELTFRGGLGGKRNEHRALDTGRRGSARAGQTCPPRARRPEQDPGC